MLVNRSNSGTYCTLLHTILDSEGLGLHVTVLARATEPPEPPIVTGRGRLPAEDSLYGPGTQEHCGKKGRCFTKTLIQVTEMIAPTRPGAGGEEAGGAAASASGRL